MFENVRKITILRGNIFFKFIFSKSKFIEFPKFQNLTFLKLGESYVSAIFYEQIDRKVYYRCIASKRDRGSASNNKSYIVVQPDF